MCQCEHSCLTLCWEFLEQGEGEEIVLLPDEIKREGKEEKVHPGKVWSSRFFSGWCGMTNEVKSKDEIAQSGGKVALLLWEAVLQTDPVVSPTETGLL